MKTSFQINSDASFFCFSLDTCVIIPKCCCLTVTRFFSPTIIACRTMQPDSAFVEQACAGPIISLSYSSLGTIHTQVGYMMYPGCTHACTVKGKRLKCRKIRMQIGAHLFSAQSIHKCVQHTQPHMHFHKTLLRYILPHGGVLDIV